MPDTFNLARFAEAQTPIYPAIVAELRAGQKRTHWMWFVFPQIAGLGQSPTSRHYAIEKLAEAQAYLNDETLGPRLTECTNLVLTHPNKTATQIFGPIDDAKFRSSMTLFACAAPTNPLFRAALKTFFNAEPDELTLQKLNPRLQP
jgi:uncharacterized protein (DUF1810 family)